MPLARSIALLIFGILLVEPAAAQDQQRGDPAWLTADQVRTVLRARGYSEVGSLQRDGDTFRINEAVRYGEKVPELRIDALTGLPRDAQLLTETQARSLLMERGYTAVQEVGREGEMIRLRARQSDTPVEVRVNARTGAVSR
jgi:hypothetical protein